MTIFKTMMDGVECLYSPENLGLAFVPEGTADKLPDPVREDLDRKVEVSLRRPLRTLYLSLTYRCNLNCKYCICHNSFGIEKKDMGPETLIQAIEKFIEFAEENTEREVVLYGGEPTLRKDLVELAFRKMRELEKGASKNLKPARFILCTNGTFIDQEFCDFLKATDIYPAVSIDGDEPLHNEFRELAGGGGSYEQSVRGYKLLRKNGIPAGITMTLGSYNVKRLPELVSIAADLFHPGSLAINMLLDYEKARNPYCASPDEAKEALWEAFQVAREKGIYIVKHVMDNRVKPFVERRPRVWGCTGTGARMAVTPEGRIVSCMALEKRSKEVKITEVEDKGDFVEAFMEAYSPMKYGKCQSCIAKSTCGGMCPASLCLRDASDDPNFCDATQYFTKKMLWLFFDLNKTTIKEALQKQGFYIATKEDRQKLYGNIKVDQEIRDFQFSPNW